MALDADEKQLLIKLELNQKTMSDILARLTATVEKHEQRSTNLEQLVQLEKKQREIEVLKMGNSVEESFKSHFKYTVYIVGASLGIVATAITIAARAGVL